MKFWENSNWIETKITKSNFANHRKKKKRVVKLSSSAFIGHVLIAERKTSVRHQG